MDDSGSDDGLCSLRKAINNANSPGVDTTGGDCVTAPATGTDDITFSVTGPILLGSALPVISTTLAVTIDGTGQTITVNGQGAYIVFSVISTVTLNDLTITNGSDGPLGGGAIYNDGTLTVTNSTVSNSGAGYGAGIFNDSLGSLTLNTDTVSGNTASAYGGAIWSTGPVLSVTNSTISGNTADVWGGGIFTESATASVTSSTLSGNTASGDGGGIFNDGGTLTVNNDTFYDNMALSGFGGGIINSGSGTLTVTSSTFDDNIALTSDGGGINNFSGTTTVNNTILAAETGGNCAGTIGFGTNSGYNISDDGTCNFGNSTAANSDTIGDNVTPAANVGLASGLATNGGPTQTIAIESGSYAILAIPTVGGFANCPGFDQRGDPRPVPTFTDCTIGAFEYGE